MVITVRLWAVETVSNYGRVIVIFDDDKAAVNFRNIQHHAGWKTFMWEL